jgi:hypothetical protein
MLFEELTGCQKNNESVYFIESEHLITVISRALHHFNTCWSSGNWFTFLHHSLVFFFFLGVGWNQVHFYWSNYWAIVPAQDDDECGTIGGMPGRGNRSTRRRPTPVPLCPPQIPDDPNLSRLGRKLATNRLSYGTAWYFSYIPLVR